tara:strand:+ start:7639 stop:7965 length:327 start_codon:yes stop_codon:yes gene_type:complete
MTVSFAANVTPEAYSVDTLHDNEHVIVMNLNFEDMTSTCIEFNSMDVNLGFMGDEYIIKNDPLEVVFVEVPDKYGSHINSYTRTKINGLFSTHYNVIRGEPVSSGTRA